MKRTIIILAIILLGAGQAWGTTWTVNNHAEMIAAMAGDADSDTVNINASFTATAQYVVDKDITIQGVLGTETITQGFDGDVFRLDATSTGATIQNFRIVGNRATYTAARCAITYNTSVSALKPNNITITGMTVSDFVGYGILIGGSDGWTISGNTISLIGDGSVPSLSTSRMPIKGNQVVSTFEDCESAVWDEYVDGNVSVTLDEVTYKTGSKSIKLAVGADAEANRILATNNLTAKNASQQLYAHIWIRSTVDLAAGDMQLLLDDTANCASPTETLDFPAVTANTWTLYTPYLANAAGDTAIVSVGIKQITDKGAFDLYLDNIYATRGVTNTTVTGNTITGDPDKTGVLVWFSWPSDNVTISNNTMTDGGAHGIKFYVPLQAEQYASKNVNITNNTITNVSHLAANNFIYWGVRDGVISGNTFTQNIQAPGTNACWAIEAGVGYNMTGTYIQDNTFTGTYLTTGISACAYGAVIRRNRIEVLACAVYDTCGAASIDNNLFVISGGYSGDKAGIYLQSYYYDEATTNIYNNTIIGTGIDKPGILVEERNATSWNWSNINLKNNIIQGFPQAVAATHVESGLPLTHTHNLYYGNTKNIQFYDGSWQDHTLDATELTSNPLLTGSYALSAGSPAVDSGVDLGTTYRTSLSGDQYRDAPWDIGACTFRRPGTYGSSKNTSGMK